MPSISIYLTVVTMNYYNHIKVIYYSYYSHSLANNKQAGLS